MMCISLFAYGRPVVVRCMGFGLVWVGLGHGSISSLAVGWVGSVIWWVGLGWVDENGPTDNSGIASSSLCSEEMPLIFLPLSSLTMHQSKQFCQAAAPRNA